MLIVAAFFSTSTGLSMGLICIDVFITCNGYKQNPAMHPLIEPSMNQCRVCLFLIFLFLSGLTESAMELGMT